MSAEDYVVVLDKELDYCRLFRADSENMPAGEVLWTGNGLRRGYDAMIRLNKDRRPVNSYNVCSKVNKRGRTVYKVVKGEPDKELTVLDVFYDFASARRAMAALTKLRDDAEQTHRDRLRSVMKRVGISSSRIPKFTPTDEKYISWLEQTGKFAA